jgi:hypothetical protein
VQAELTDDQLAPKVWNQDVFKLSYGTLDSLLKELDASDAGIFVLRGDDLTTSRDTTAHSVRDNVIFEVGMFMGRLGRDRTFMLTPTDQAPRLWSDVYGITTAGYDESRVSREQRAAVAPACTEIRDHLASLRTRPVQEPAIRERLDRAMRRMSQDLELLLAGGVVDARGSHDEPLSVSARIKRADVHVEAGRIQNYPGGDADAVIALPANEYFDDECITDPRSSLGAYVQSHFKDSPAKFREHVNHELADRRYERVPRGERRIDDSYGIGQAILLTRLLPDHRIILVSVTTERAGVGPRAEPHFLYAAMRGVIEAMNANKYYSLVMPVLGSGHGGMPLPVALLFNLLAVRSSLVGDPGLRLDRLRLIVFEGVATQVSRPTVEEVMARVAAAG